LHGQWRIRLQQQAGFAGEQQNILGKGRPELLVGFR
jgi:hypothetical protein